MLFSRHRLLLGVVFAALLLIVGIAAAAEDNVHYGGTLVVGTAADPAGGLDPECVMNNEAAFIMATIYNRLVEYGPGSVKIVPGLAESWDISPDGLVYTFHLRHGVTFHDGTKFDAHALKLVFDRLLDPNYPYYYAKRKGIDSYVPGTLEANVASYKVVDDYTFELTLSHPYAPLLQDLAMVWFGIVSPAAVEKYGLEVYKHPVGTGPFEFVEWVPNDHVTVKANPNYWRGKPKVDKIIFKQIPEGSVRTMMLQAGEIDIMMNVPPESIKILENDPGVKLYKLTALLVNYIGIPRMVPPFNDIRVRQALNYAVNKKELCEYLYQGLAVPMRSPMPPGMPGYRELEPDYAYNPEKAKQLLTEAGYPNGFDCNLYTYGNPRSYNPAGGKLATALQGYWKKVGINVHITQLEWGSYLRTTRDPNFKDGMDLRGWTADCGDPDNFLYYLYYGKAGNIPHAFDNRPEIDSLIEQERVCADPDKRAQLIDKALDLIWKDAGDVWLTNGVLVRASTTKVHGFQLDPLSMFFYADQIWKEP